jgi:hypothetical protein
VTAEYVRLTCYNSCGLLLLHRTLAQQTLHHSLLFVSIHQRESVYRASSKSQFKCNGVSHTCIPVNTTEHLQYEPHDVQVSRDSVQYMWSLYFYCNLLPSDLQSRMVHLAYAVTGAVAYNNNK